MHELSTADLERELGTPALMSLDARGLLPKPGSLIEARRTGSALADRVSGALAGAVIGSALGLPWEWEHLGGLRPEEVIARLDPSAHEVGDVLMLRCSLTATLEAGLSAPSALANRLSHRPRPRHAGRATPAAIARLRQGMPWFEAGVGSFGSGAIVRAVATGIAHRANPTIRPVVAALDCAITHATPRATESSAAVADLIAHLLDHDGPLDATAFIGVLSAYPQLDGPAQNLQRQLLDRRPAPAGAEAVDVLVAALCHLLLNDGDPETAILSAVLAGGDTDTTAALTGAFCGAARGLDAIPIAWRDATDGTEELLSLGLQLIQQEPTKPASPDVDPSATGVDGLHVSVLLDRSASMRLLAGDVVSGVNQFLAEHRSIEGCRVTLVQFDSEAPFEVLLDDADSRTTPTLRHDQYQPRGMTPLYDAIGALLDHAHAWHDGSAAADQVVVIFTDGLENASRCWTRDAVFRRIDELQAAGWAFVFMGANQDSYEQGGELGIARGNTSNYRSDRDGVRDAWSSLSRASAVHARKPRTQRRAEREEWFQGTKEAEWGL